MRHLLALVVVAAAIGGCASSKPRASSHGTASEARAGDVSVVRGWAQALAAGDLNAASGYFALPTTIQNGTPALQLSSRRLVRAFNASLPCGARLVGARSVGRYTVATFRLIERPGGSCGTGTGNLAATAFVIRGSKIVEWRRAPVPGTPQSPPPPSPAPGGGALSS